MEAQIQVLWLCGLPYVRKAQFKDFAIELLAVPIPLGSRYRAEPIYFSDVVVKRESRFRSFYDLRGSSWAYNEPMSHSGFNVCALTSLVSVTGKGFSERSSNRDHTWRLSR